MSPQEEPNANAPASRPTSAPRGADLSPVHPLPKTGIFAVGTYIMISTAYIVYVLYKIWPYEIPFAEDEGDIYVLPFYSVSLILGAETRYLLISFFSGMLGSLIQNATSFVYFVGTGKIDRRWVWWYILRPFTGGSLALAIYFTARGGFFAGNGGTENLDLYGIASMSVLAGLFSRQAIDKLDEVFKTLFRTRKQENEEEQNSANQPGAGGAD